MATRTATVASARPKRKSRPFVRWIKRLTLLFLMIFCIGFIVGAAIFATEYKQAQAKLANLPTLMSQLELEPTTIYSADGKVLYVTSNQYRLPVHYKDIPKSVINATIAAEDIRFYHHNGVDIPSLARIAVEAMKDKRLSQGGSTLTMQLAKRLYTNSERSLKRKVGDMAMAVAMERELTKEQILELYLNEVFFGSNAYGVKAAAEVYLGKPLNKVDVSDAALLIRCVRRPSDETPFTNLKKATQNRNVVLKIMRDEGSLTQKEYEKAVAKKVKLNPNPPATTARLLRAPYFVDHVLQTLRSDMPDIDFTKGGYKIYTTIDSQIQKTAEKAVDDTVKEFKGYSVNTGAFVLIDYKGRILAEVGGESYKRNQYNVVTQGHRQPGSSFKSFLYSAAIAQGITSADGTVSNDRYQEVDPWTHKVWAPKNDRPDYGGRRATRTMFALSYNVAAVRLILELGPQTLVDYARNVFGFQSEIPAVKSMALGVCEVSPLEMARGYSVFMTGGDRVDPYPIDRIVGPDGQVVRKYEPRITQNVLDPRVVNQVRELQRAVVTSGTGTRANDVPNARGKTGTTQENKDAWFCGYTDGLTGIAWVSNEQREGNRWVYKPMSRRAFGGTTAIHIWRPVMKLAHEKYAVQIPDREVATVPANGDARFATDEELRRAEDRETKTTVQEIPPTPDPNETNAQPETEPASNPEENTPDPDVPAAEPPPVVKPKPKPAPPPVQYVDVEICADSHELATMYCPETVVRTYVKGKEPGRRCHVHGPG